MFEINVSSVLIGSLVGAVFYILGSRLFQEKFHLGALVAFGFGGAVYGLWAPTAYVIFSTLL